MSKGPADQQDAKTLAEVYKPAEGWSASELTSEIWEHCLPHLLGQFRCFNCQVILQ